VPESGEKKEEKAKLGESSKNLKETREKLLVDLGSTWTAMLRDFKKEGIKLFPKRRRNHQKQTRLH